MRPTRLILLEGIPGAGKSSAAHALHRLLTRLAIPHRWWYEGERGHPVYAFRDTASLDRTIGDLFSGDAARIDGVLADSLERWGALATRLRRSGRVGILDGILYGHLVWTLFPAGVPVDTIEAYVAEEERRIAPLDPCVVYFRPDDVAAAMRRITARRGSQWTESMVRRTERFPYSRQYGLAGFDGFVAFWAAYRDLADTLFARSTLAKCRVTAEADDWAAGMRRVCAFLDLPDDAQNVAPAAGAAESGAPDGQDLSRFAGTYTFTHRGERRRCDVTLENGALYLTGVPDIWTHTRLIALAPQPAAGRTRFAIESMPFECTFVEDGGTVREMRLTGPAFVWGSLPGRFRRSEQ